MVNFEKVNANWDAGNNHKKLILIDLTSFYFFNNFFFDNFVGYFKPMFMWIFVDSRFNSAHSTGTFKDQYGEGF